MRIYSVSSLSRDFWRIIAISLFLSVAFGVKAEFGNWEKLQGLGGPAGEVLGSAVSGACNANTLVLQALLGNTEEAQSLLNQAVQDFDLAADQINSLLDQGTYDGYVVQPYTPGLDGAVHLFPVPPREVNEILRAMEERATKAKESAERIRDGTDSAADLTTLLTTSTEMMRLMVLLGEALILSV
jgi:hypothetical protein